MSATSFERRATGRALMALMLAATMLSLGSCGGTGGGSDDEDDDGGDGVCSNRVTRNCLVEVGTQLGGIEWRIGNACDDLIIVRWCLHDGAGESCDITEDSDFEHVPPGGYHGADKPVIRAVEYCGEPNDDVNTGENGFCDYGCVGTGVIRERVANRASCTARCEAECGLGDLACSGAVYTPD